MELINRVVLLWILIQIVSCENQQGLSKNEYRDKVKKAINVQIDSLLQNPNINSAAIGVIAKEEEILAYYGELNPGKEDIPTDKTTYEIASATKAFTGLLVAKAIEDKIVSLDDEVGPYFGNDLGNFPNAIKVKHLLTHTSGLPFMLPQMGEVWETNYESLKANPNFNYKTYFIEQLSKIAIDTEPNEKYQYSNVGATLLGFLLEEAYKKSYSELLSSNITDKLKMKNTTLYVTDSTLLADGYFNDTTLMPHYPGAYPAARGLKSTLPDLMKFMKWNMQESDNFVKLSHSKLLDHTNPSAYRAYYWLVNLGDDNSRRLSIHGGAYGMQTWIMFYPEKEIGIILITNQSGPDTGGKIIQTSKNIVNEMMKLLPTTR